jgi:pyridoxamine 5'-phosphate oxidase
MAIHTTTTTTTTTPREVHVSQPPPTKLWQHGDQYAGETLDPASAAADPFDQFRAWFAAAEAAGVPAVNAMTLATVNADGTPAARVVLLKELDASGLTFFTNYDSAKGQQLAAHPAAALVFYWAPQHRQVRVEGAVERVTAAESDAYFAVRPRGSQIGALASPQSRELGSRDELVARVATVEAELAGATPARPGHWGGFRVIPRVFEFWQGQDSRLHDRVRYQRDGAGWRRVRLAP